MMFPGALAKRAAAIAAIVRPCRGLRINDNNMMMSQPISWALPGETGMTGSSPGHSISGPK